MAGYPYHLPVRYDFNDLHPLYLIEKNFASRVNYLKIIKHYTNAEASVARVNFLTEVSMKPFDY